MSYITQYLWPCIYITIFSFGDMAGMVLQWCAVLLLLYFSVLLLKSNRILQASQKTSFLDHTVQNTGRFREYEDIPNTQYQWKGEKKKKNKQTHYNISQLISKTNKEGETKLKSATLSTLWQKCPRPKQPLVKLSKHVNWRLDDRPIHLQCRSLKLKRGDSNKKDTLWVR